MSKPDHGRTYKLAVQRHCVLHKARIDRVDERQPQQPRDRAVISLFAHLAGAQQLGLDRRAVTQRPLAHSGNHRLGETESSKNRGLSFRRIRIGVAAKLLVIGLPVL
ncbi:hypothetical protein D3C87_1681190 [compost metagenome]